MSPCQAVSPSRLQAVDVTTLRAVLAEWRPLLLLPPLHRTCWMTVKCLLEGGCVRSLHLCGVCMLCLIHLFRVGLSDVFSPCDSVVEDPSTAAVAKPKKKTVRPAE
jgi:hypothetical protein